MRMDIEIGLTGIKEIGPNEFKVNLKMVSKVDLTLIIQKAKGVKSLKQALKERDGLKEEALRELIRREQLGSLWGKLATDWLVGITTGRIQTSKNLSAKKLYDYNQTAQKYTKRWWKKPAAEITTADVKQLFYDIVHEYNRSQTT